MNGRCSISSVTGEIGRSGLTATIARDCASHPDRRPSGQLLPAPTTLKRRRAEDCCSQGLGQRLPTPLRRHPRVRTACYLPAWRLRGAVHKHRPRPPVSSTAVRVAGIEINSSPGRFTWAFRLMQISHNYFSFSLGPGSTARQRRLRKFDVHLGRC